MEFILPELPFKKDSLAPFMSAETLEYHYGKHHRGYVQKLNTILASEQKTFRSLEDIICSSEGKLFNNASQAWNHTFFWHCLSQEARHNNVSEDLNQKVNSTFGSMDQMQEKFNQVAQDIFGTGWCWLVKDSHGQLKIMGTEDAENPMVKGLVPILTCDMWEHAYYLDYRNSREKYLNAFWQIINWEFVSDRYHDTSTVSFTEEMTKRPESSAQV